TGDGEDAAEDRAADPPGAGGLVESEGRALVVQSSPHFHRAALATEIAEISQAERALLPSHVGIVGLDATRVVEWAVERERSAIRFDHGVVRPCAVPASRAETERRPVFRADLPSVVDASDAKVTPRATDDDARVIDDRAAPSDRAAACDDVQARA